MPGRTRLALLLILICSLVLTACGGTSSASAPAAAPTAPPAPTGNVAGVKLDSVKQYLLDYGKNDLQAGADTLKTNVDQYYAALKAANFDYRAAWASGATLRPLVLTMRTAFNQAHTGYENVEGIVAGVPSLSQFDTILDAGARGSEGGDNVADYRITLPDGSSLDKPGNHFHHLLEPMIYGTDPAVLKLADIDVDGDGTVGFGDALPDANLLKGVADSFVSYVNQTMDAINGWQPTAQDAFTALVTMTPTMGEYFNNWKESRYVSGTASTETAFVAHSRLADVVGILASLRTIYAGVEPAIQAKDPAAATQINQSYRDLATFVQGLLDKEQAGTKFTPDQADVLGKTAQNQAQVVTGQVTQAAALLQINLDQ